MKTIRLALLASVAAAPLLAQEMRETGAHVHGDSTLELAVEEDVVEMNLYSPGMDIVGFEYAARSGADRDAVEAAIRTMLVPENVVTLPEAAECRLTGARAYLDAGDHDDEGDGDHDHADGKANGHEKHAEGEDHDHEEAAGHSAFHMRYSFACEHPEALKTIGFPLFVRFGNAQKIAAQYVSDTGAGAAGIGRDAPELILK